MSRLPTAVVSVPILLSAARTSLGRLVEWLLLERGNENFNEAIAASEIKRRRDMRTRWTPILTCLAAVLVGSGSSTLHAGSFRGVGVLPGGTDSVVTGISADGWV